MPTSNQILYEACSHQTYFKLVPLILAEATFTHDLTSQTPKIISKLALTLGAILAYDKHHPPFETLTAQFKAALDSLLLHNAQRNFVIDNEALEQAAKYFELYKANELADLIRSHKT